MIGIVAAEAAATETETATAETAIEIAMCGGTDRETRGATAAPAARIAANRRRAAPRAPRQQCPASTRLPARIKRHAWINHRRRAATSRVPASPEQAVSARAMSSGPAMSAAGGAGGGAAAVGVRVEKPPLMAQIQAQAQAQARDKVRIPRALPPQAPASAVRAAVPLRRRLRSVILRPRLAPPRFRPQAPAPTINTSSGRPRRAMLRAPGRTIGRLKRLRALADAACADASSGRSRRTPAPRRVREARPRR